MCDHEPDNPIHSHKYYTIKSRVPNGTYIHIEDIIRVMNISIKKKMAKEYISEKRWPRFEYDDARHCVNAIVPGRGHIEMDEHLTKILSFQDTKNVEIGKDCMTTKTLMTGERVEDFGNEIQTVYVYCDILQNVPVGDTEAPLLRVVSATGKAGDVIHRTFLAPRYLPVRNMEFDTIEIDIRDSFGKPIPFDSGSLNVTLHFRKATDSYYS